MKFEFDATNDREVTAVFVALAILRDGDLSFPQLFGDDDQERRGQSDIIPLAVPVPPVPAVPPAVPAPPAAAVPAPPAASPAPAAASGDLSRPAGPAGPQLDKEGLPWDKRIHSNPATIKADGCWRSKRGLDAATKEAVTAELRQAMAAPPPGPPAPMFEEAAPGVPLEPSPDTADASTVFAGGAAAASSVPAPPVAAVPPPPVPAVPAAPAPAPAATAFADLMRKITGMQTAGTLTVEGVQQIAQSLGITGVRDLMARPDLIPSFDALLPQG